MSQKLPVNGSEWKESIHKFNEDFIKNYDEVSNKGFFLEVKLNVQKICLFFIVIYRFYLKERKSKNLISFFVTYLTKKTMLFT